MSIALTTFLKVWFKGTPRNFMRPLFFSKMCKIIPKRIVYYSIGSHSAQLVLLYLQKCQHKFLTSTSLNSCCWSVKASVSCLSPADSRVFSARCVTLRLLFAFIHFNHKFHEHSQEHLHHWAALDPVSLPWGPLVQLASQTKLPAP